MQLKETLAMAATVLVMVTIMMELDLVEMGLGTEHQTAQAIVREHK